MLLHSRKPFIPGVPLPARLKRGARFDIGDVEAAPEQFDFSLGLGGPINNLATTRADQLAPQVVAAKQKCKATGLT